MITMMLGGLWHGAAWTFVLWGALHGAGLSVEHAVRGARLARVPVWLRWFVVLHVVVLGWILFRSPDLAAVGEFLSRLAHPGPATLWSVPVVLAVLAVFVVQRAARLAPAGALVGPAPPSRDARPGPRIGHPGRRRDGPQPGRPAVHLLPVLR